MPAPRNTARMMGEYGVSHSGNAATVCQGSRHHSPTPMFVTAVPVIPVSWDIQLSGSSDTVWLCATCHDNLRVLQELLAVSSGSVPWSVRREFGNEIRRIGCDGWRVFTSLKS